MRKKPHGFLTSFPVDKRGGSVGRGRNFASSSLNTVVSTDPRPLRDRQSGHFLETASLHPPQAALRRFPAPLPLTVQNAETILHLRPLAKFSKRVGRMITTFPAWSALRISKPWFWRRFLHTFCRCWQKVCRRRLTRPPPSPLDRRRPHAVQYPLTVMPVFPSNSRNRSLLCRNFSTPTAGFPILPRG